jgi:hypothetical protein
MYLSCDVTRKLKGEEKKKRISKVDLVVFVELEQTGLEGLHDRVRGHRHLYEPKGREKLIHLNTH